MRISNDGSLPLPHRKSTYCRPLTAFFPSRSRTNATEQCFNLSIISRTKQSQTYTTRRKPNDKPLYRSLRSTSLYENVRPHQIEDRKWKLQIINNTCLKRIYESNSRATDKESFVYNVNEVLSKHISSDLGKKENCLAKYHCKKLKIIKGKMKLGSRMLTEWSNEQEMTSASLNVGVIGTKLL